MKVKSKPDELLTPEEVADRLKVPERRVLNMMRDGEIEFIQLRQGRRIRESVLNAWLDERTHEAVA
jgi:excisionase family DNA binding protein